MTNTYIHTDYDLYDDFNSKKFRRGKKRRFIQGGRPPRKPPMRFDFKGFPTKIKPYTKKKLKIIKGRPTKLPPIVIKNYTNTGVMPPNKKASTLLVKTKGGVPNKKKKTPIEQLIKKTVAVKDLKRSIPTTTIIPEAENKAITKAAQSDSKVSKVVKVVAIIGVLGVAGYGIYKYVKLKKTIKKTSGK